jgi:CBS domain-containing protein
MSRLPVEAEQCELAGDALELMRRYRIHHLPVMSGSHFKGIATRQGLLEAQIRLGNEFASTSLLSVCETNVITTSPVDAIDDLCRQMLASESDHAVVIDGGFVVGILTATDLLRFIADTYGK